MIGRKKSRHCQTQLEWTPALLLFEWKFTAKAELNSEIYKCWRKCWKNHVSFCHRSIPVSEKLGCCLENYRSWKNTLEKLVVKVNLEAIWFEFWMKGAGMTTEIFVSCGWWFSNQLDIVSETHFSCDTVDRGLWLAILSSLLFPEMDRNIPIWQQGYVFYFTDFKKWCFDFFFLTSISVSTAVLILRKVEFFK